MTEFLADLLKSAAGMGSYFAEKVTRGVKSSRLGARARAQGYDKERELFF